VFLSNTGPEESEGIGSSSPTGVVNRSGPTGFDGLIGSMSVLATRAASGWAADAAGLTVVPVLLAWGWDREGAVIIPTSLSQKEPLLEAVTAG
jgi:hypothetical protein